MAKFSKEFNKYLQREVKNFNARRDYLAKQRPEDAPRRVKVSEIKKFYQNEVDANRRIKQLQAFSKKSATNYLKMGKYHTKVNEYRYQRYLENKDVALAELEKAYDNQQRLDRARGFNLPSDRTLELLSRIKTIKKGTSPRATVKQVNAAMNYALRWTEQRIETDQQFYENFDTMFFSQADKVGIDPKLLEKMQEQFRELTPDELLDMFENEKDVNRIVRDYNLTKDTEGVYLTDKEKTKEKKDLEELAEVLPEIIKRYKKAS